MRTLLLSSFRVSAETLGANPLRTFLSTLGIIIGVASLVAVLSLGDGMQQFMRDQIGQTTDLQAIGVSAMSSRDVGGVAVPVDSPITFTLADARSLVAAVKAPAVAGLMASGGALYSLNGVQHGVRLIGTTPALFGIQNLTVSAGRPFTDAELEAPVALITRRAAAAMVAPGAKPLGVGDSITLGSLRLAVVGLLGGTTTEQTALVVLPVGVMRRAMPAGTVWDPSILVRADRIEDVDVARRDVERWMGERYGSRWRDRARVVNRAERVAQAQQALLMFKLLMGAITGISLLVGGIGVMNVLLAAVAERTREIGVRRAVGAARRHIVAQFLAESVTISAAGSLAGIVLGLAGAYGITAVIRANTRALMYAGVSVGTILIAVGATVLVGLTFGLYPALMASRLSPIDAIRHE